jgi:hypothetical protein
VTLIVAEYDPAARSARARSPYGRVAVFLDVAGNRWDLLSGPGV